MRTRPLALLVVASAVASLAAAGCTGATPSNPGGPAVTASAGGCFSGMRAGDTTIALTVGAIAREAIVHVPPAAKPGSSLPAFLFLHGYTGHASEMPGYTGLSAAADAKGFVVVYPQALSTPPEWHLFGGYMPSATLQQNDRDFAAALVDWLEPAGCVNMSRVFVGGHSQGGGMAADLACEMPNRFAGVALVSAMYHRLPCSTARSIAVVAFHALDDPTLPFRGGDVASTPDDFPHVLAVEDVVKAWAAIDGCGAAAPEQDAGDGMTKLAWTGCTRPVTFYRMASGGHQYQTPSTDRILDFFASV